MAGKILKMSAKISAKKFGDITILETLPNITILDKLPNITILETLPNITILETLPNITTIFFPKNCNL